MLPSRTPILSADEAEEARTAVTAVVDDLLHLPPERLVSRLDGRRRPSLGALEPWTALLFAYYEEATGTDLGDAVDHRLAEAHLHLASQFPSLDLFGGWCGLGWALEHLTESANGEENLAGLDAQGVALLEELAAQPKQAALDLVGGLVGLGVYLVERLPRPAARRGLELLVGHLERRAEPTPRGHLTWRTPAHLLPAHRRVEGGAWDLGVAHGVPGIVALLARIHEAGIARAAPQELLEGAVGWVLEQRLAVDDGPSYPRRLAPEEEPEPCRIAWCYGDLGIAVVLTDAGLRVGRGDWRGAGLELARHAATVRGEASGVIDPGLCHGAAGNGHLFHRLYQATGDEACRAAARHWFRETLRYRSDDRGIGGFQSNFPGHPTTPWQDDAAFLTGATGIALALLAATTELEPGWDRLLLAG